jgi:hypothetical protein
MFNFKLFSVLIIACLAICLADRIEPATKQKFHESDKGLSLAGVGVRVKKIGPVSAKVYAAGMYVNKFAAMGTLKTAAASCKSASDLAKSKGFEDALVKGNFQKNIVLKMARTVGCDTMVNALADSLKPRLSGGSGAALEKFQSVLLEGLKDGGAKNNMVLR